MQVREDLSARLLYSDDTSHFAPRERGIVGGHVQNRWQYGPERQNKHLRYKCGNKAKIEASIVEAVILEEVSDLRTSYYPDHVPLVENGPFVRSFSPGLVLNRH